MGVFRSFTDVAKPFIVSKAASPPLTRKPDARGAVLLSSAAETQGRLHPGCRMPGRINPGIIYTCGPWEIDPGRRELRSRDTPVVLGSRAFEVLEILVEAGGQLVTKDDLMARIWPGLTVGEN